MAHRPSPASNTTNTKWSGTTNTAASLNVPSPSHRVTRSSARLAESVQFDSSSPSQPTTQPSLSKKRKASGRQDLSPSREAASQSSPLSSTRSKAKRRKTTDTPVNSEQSTPAASRRLGNKKSTSASTAMSGNGSSSRSHEDVSKSFKTTSKRSSSRTMKKPLRDISPSNETPPRRSKKRASKKDNDISPAETETKPSKPEESTPPPPPPPPDQDEENGNNDPNEGSLPDADGNDDDSLAATLFGRGASAGLSTTLRALSGMMSGLSSRLRDILSNLKQVDNPTMQLIALEELSNLLLVSNEDNLSGQFSPDPYVKELVALMQPNPITGEENPEIMLLACRCIANLMEALRGSVANVVYGGAVPVLCQKLLDIQYIDVAEQALSTLSMISVDFPASIVREGGLTACLQFLEFFATGTQRTAVKTAANCCRNIPQESFPVIRDVMPILQNVLLNHDQKVVEQGSLCVTRIIDSFKRSPEKLEELVDLPLLRAILGLLLPGTTNLIGASIHTEFLKVLAIVARSSPKMAAELLKLNIVDTLYQVLTGVSPPDGSSNVASKIDSVVIMQALIHRPREQIYEALNVICELLPAPTSDHNINVDLSNGLDGSFESIPDKGMAVSQVDQRLEYLKDCKSQTRHCAMILLPTLTDAYSSTVNLSVRQKVLTAQLKILSNLETGIVEEALRPVPYASFLASIISQEDHSSLVLFALQAVGLLLERLPVIYQYQFQREGVVTEIEKIAARHLESETKASTKAHTDQELSTSKTALNNPANTSTTNPKDDKLRLQKEVQSRNTRGGDDGDSRELHDSNEDDKSDDNDNVDDEDEDEDDEDDDDDDDDDDDVDVDDDDDNANGQGDDDDELDDELMARDDGEIESDSSDSSEDSSHHPMVKNNANDLVIARAKALIQIFDTEKGRELRAKADQIRNDLDDLSLKLVNCYMNDDGSQDGKDLFGRLARYFGGDALQSITSSELLNSGVISALTEILTSQSQIIGHPADDFLTAFNSSTSSAITKISVDDEHITSLTILIQKLQDLLSRTEHFEVLTVNSSAAENSRSSSTAMLSRQIRLKLSANSESDIPTHFREMIVSIHAIATFKALDDYLRPRMSLSERPALGQRRRDMLQQFANARMAQLQNAAGLGMLSPFGSEFGLPPPLPSTGDIRTSSRLSSGLKPTQEDRSETRGSFETPVATRTHRNPSSATASTSQARTAAMLEGPEPDTQDNMSKLECADERPLDKDNDNSEGDGEEEHETLDAIIGELEETGAQDDSDPGAVNMEVGSTGKVLARQEDGTRVFTPQQPGTPVQGAAKSSNNPSPSLTSQRTKETAAHTRPSSYAAALASSPQDWHIEFSIDDKVVPQNTTVYRAVHQNQSNLPESATKTVWSTVHPVKFRKVKGPPNSVEHLNTGSDDRSDDAKGLPPSLNGHPVTSSILSLLGVLHDLNASIDARRNATSYNGLVKHVEPPASFINTKLTAKMNRQLEEPLIVASNCLPEWSEDLARAFPFLFPFETRHLFLQSTSFGYSRSIVRWQGNQDQNDDRRDRRRDDRPLMGRPQRQKVRISRSRILESAMKVMEMYGASPSVLEVEYFDEVGTGLGPTLEFYATVSREFSKKKLKMWRENDSNDKDPYAFGKGGLFPAPMKISDVTTEAAKKLLHFFKMLGKFVARSMLDSRMIDVNFSPTFFKIGLESATSPSITLLKTIDSDLANSLEQLQQYVTAKKMIEMDEKKTADQKIIAMSEITVNSARINDLALDFTLPGYPGFELITDGSNTDVTLDNVEEYITSVLDMSLGSGVANQIRAFQNGFSQVFSFSSLKAFTPKELVMLFGRVEEDWSIESLMDSIKADHGFNMDSKCVKNLLQIMSELSLQQRRDFLQFATGSPKLPIGGFKNLTPMFTVVCRASEPPYTPDDYLPTVMTCANYFKLPDYSDLDVMRTRLHFAIKEGQGSFHMS